MKKIALLAVVAFSFAAISCKEETKVATTESEVVTDTLNAEVDSTIVEAPITEADSVDNVTVDTVKTETEVK